MYQDDPGLEQRLSRFEAQLDRFSLALHQWQTQDTAKPSSGSEVDQRIRALEATADNEAHALRQMHEEPLRQLQLQADALKQLCAAAHLSVNSLGQAEARLLELQNSVSVLIGDLSRLVTEMQIGAARNISPHASTTAWPLERVVHLHDELRRGGNSGTAALPPASVRGNTARVVRAAPREPEHPEAPETAGTEPPRSKYLVAGSIVAVAAIVLIGAFFFERRLTDAANRVDAAEKQVAETTKAASQEVATARQDADRQIAEARGVAQRAETVGNILTAPDLIRFNLTSVVEDGSSAQLLWSRTRGLVLSGTRLPAAPPQSTYQLWLVTNTRSIGAGVFVPDESGRATMVVDAPPKIAGAVVGAAVTIEPPGGRPTPTGRTLLARFPQ
jgi:Anti-sigma-K factor rskA, C-terminal